jgi:hypothetical protein
MQAEEEEHAQQQEVIEEGVTELRQGVEEGMTQEQLEEIAEEHGIELDPHYQEEMSSALEEQRIGEEHRVQIEQDVETHNTEAEAEAERRRREEEEAQAEALRQQEALIAESQSADEAEITEDSEQVPPPAPEPEPLPQPKPEPDPVEEDHPEVDQTDSDRVDETAGEEPYTEDQVASNRSDLEELRMMALALDVDENELGLDDYTGPRMA